MTSHGCHDTYRHRNDERVMSFIACISIPTPNCVIHRTWTVRTPHCSKWCNFLIMFRPICTISIIFHSSLPDIGVVGAAPSLHCPVPLIPGILLLWSMSPRHRTDPLHSSTCRGDMLQFPHKSLPPVFMTTVKTRYMEHMIWFRSHLPTIRLSRLFMNCTAYIRINPIFDVHPIYLFTKQRVSE